MEGGLVNDILTFVSQDDPADPMLSLGRPNRKEVLQGIRNILRGHDSVFTHWPKHVDENSHQERHAIFIGQTARLHIEGHVSPFAFVRVRTFVSL